MSETCEAHPYPRDFIESVAGWRFASGNFQTARFYYRSRYYYADIMKLRCQVCGAIFNQLMVWYWTKDGYYLIDRNDDELYPMLKAIVVERYADRLSKYDVRE